MTPDEEISALKSTLLDIQKILIDHQKIIGVYQSFFTEIAGHLKRIDEIIEDDESPAMDEAGEPVEKLQSPLEKSAHPDVVFVKQGEGIEDEEERMYR